MAEPGTRIVTDAGPTDAAPPFRFSLRTVVGLADTDAAGVVYFGRWARFVEQAISEYRRMLGIPILGDEGHMIMIRSFTMHYHAAGWLGDPIEVFVRCARLGRSSYGMEARIERADGEHPHLADGRIVAVGVDAWGPGAVPTEIPGPVRAAITSFEGEALRQPS